MSGIFGLIRHDGTPVGEGLATMRDAMPEWGPDGFGRWCEGAVGLGQARRFSMPESRFEEMPAADERVGFAFTAAGRLDNRDALVAELGLPDHGRRLADTAVMMAAYRRWGDGAAPRLRGDWSFAAWHPDQRRLLLARDQLGMTGLYYYSDARVFAFSTSQRALLSLRLTPIELDELYLAQYLISWPRYHGERTPSSAVRRLPPAHMLTVTPDRLRTACYWRLEDQTERRLPARSDYVVALRETFDEAVRTRLRSEASVGVMLSGGLDSGSVAVTAAPMLRAQHRRLIAFTSVPLGPVRDDDRRFGDELPFVKATAAAAGHLEVVPVSASTVTPIQGIRRGLELFGEPIHAASNLYWLLELLERAREAGCGVLLIGAVGNASISWAGDPLSMSIPLQLHTLGPGQWARRRVQRGLRDNALGRLRKRRLDPGWHRASAIDPEFAARLGLARRRLEDRQTTAETSLEKRLSILKPGRSLGGANLAMLGARHGIDMRDPTGDTRVLSLTLSVPDRIFRDPRDGSGRWLVREAMRDRLPDQVRLNQRIGLQAADIVTRLRSSADEVLEALGEVQSGPAAAYLDMPHMQASWRAIQAGDTRATQWAAVSILTRGIMAGLYVNAVSRGDVPGVSAAGRSRV